MYLIWPVTPWTWSWTWGESVNGKTSSCLSFFPWGKSVDFYLFFLSVWHLREKGKKREVKSKRLKIKRAVKLNYPHWKKSTHTMGEKVKKNSIVTGMFSRKPVTEIFHQHSTTPIYTHSHALLVACVCFCCIYWWAAPWYFFSLSYFIVSF